ncbi:MAG: anti-sigma factor, partial [Acidobacteriota bacterium]
MTQAKEERALDLLVARATEGLAAAEVRELDGLLAQIPELDEDPSLELAAAAVDLAYTLPHQERMPDALHMRVASQASDFFATQPASTSAPAAAADDTVVRLSDRAPARSSDPTRWLGWMAAAAVLLVALLTRTTETVEPPPPVDPPKIAEVETPPTEAESRLAMIEGAGDLVRIDWSATEDPAAQTANGEAASGDVVWSNADQSGYMRFSGLAINDPTQEQYQLWIFDAEQDEKYPIDGGVFDITAEGEVVVAIDPKLRVVTPTLFAITVEKPGGV